MSIRNATLSIKQNAARLMEIGMETYELCTWGFIVQQYTPIASGSLDEMKAERDRVWSQREREGRYTDLGTFSIRKVDA